VMVNDSVKKAIDLMIKNQIGSLVVFDPTLEKKPIGLITVRGLLASIAQSNADSKQIDFSKQFKEEKLRLAKKQAFKKFDRLLKANALLANKVKSISLDLKSVTKNNPKVRLPLMEITALVRLSAGNKTIWTKVKGRRISLMVDEVIDHIKRLISKQSRK